MEETKIKPNQGFEFSLETNEIIPAFIKFQSKLGFAKKNETNPFYKNKYANLKEVWGVIKQPLADCGLAVLQFPSMLSYVGASLKEYALKQYSGQHGPYDKLVWTGNYVEVKVREIMITTLVVHNSGQYLQSWYIGTPSDNTDQAKGVTITYGRRYSLMPILGISPEDTDGNQHNVPKTPPKPKPTETTTKPKASLKSNFEEYLRDSFGRNRFNKKANKLDDKFQKENNLIITAEFLVLMGLIKKKLNGDFEQFKRWLRFSYGCEFYDIKNNDFKHIVDLLHSDPNVLLDIPDENTK